MVFCSDKAATFLTGLDYNVIKHPYAGLVPPAVIGRSDGDPQAVWLGELQDLIKDSQAEQPKPSRPAPAADISGRSSSAMSFGVGAGLLSSFVGGLGGSLEVSAKYTNAKTMQFIFREVQKIQVKPSAVSEYIETGDIQWDSPLFRPFLDSGRHLYVVTEVAVAKELMVRYERGGGTAAKVQLPELTGLVSGDVTVAVGSNRSHEITYTGQRPVTFAFKCFELGLDDGGPTLVNVRAGGVALSLSVEGDAPLGAAARLTPVGAPLLALKRVEGEDNGSE
ncbi:gasdermin [Streptomyces sp. NPDC002676]